MVAAIEFGFIGGAMGTAVGEAITRAAELAARQRLPLLIITASGGARMQEGCVSLMQMAKTSAALAVLAEQRIPVFVLLTDPTYGGVTASFATLGRRAPRRAGRHDWFRRPVGRREHDPAEAAVRLPAR